VLCYIKGMAKVGGLGVSGGWGGGGGGVGGCVRGGGD